MPDLKDIGALDGREDLRKVGVISAANYFAIKELHAEGHNGIGMGLSRAFIDDGVFQYRQKWRPVLTMASEQVFLFRIPMLTDAARGLLATFYFVTPTESGPSRARFVTDGQVDPAPELLDANIDGVDSATWYSLAGSRIAPLTLPAGDVTAVAGRVQINNPAAANDSSLAGSKMA